MNAQRPQTGPFNVGDRILDKFEVRGLLGKGGHAFVYDCFNAFLAEEVAIKVIPNLVHRGNQLFNRARGEAQVLYRLNHPHVVRVMDGGEVDGMAYIVMEKLEGMTLRAMLSKIGPLTVYEALTIALQVAEALEAAHAMNVIHRDLKPDNIFLLAENHVKVLDFGIAKFLEGGYQTTQKDLIQGTAPYMSPEQAQGHGVTFASDIFQLGVIMYEMIAGLCPCFVGVEEPPSPQIIVAMQISKLPPRLKSIVPAVPSYVDRLIWRALAKEARQRFPVMQEFTDAIRAALDRMRAELPPQELAVRAVQGSRTPAHAPRHDSRSPAVPRTTPVALVTPKPNRADGARAIAALPFDPASGGGVSTQKPAADPQAARRLFTRAVLIGTALALPIGMGIVLFERSHSHPTETTAATSAAGAPLPPRAQAVQPSSQPNPLAPPPSVMPIAPAPPPMIEPSPTGQPIARAAPVATTTLAKSPTTPIPKALPASGLISDSPKRTPSAPLAPKPDAAPSSSKPMPKLIF
ncbi:MAG TPA: protein kinase [Polyangiaceae bacterium]|nr:protein kinase [Polyangiaceae bacterium]